jgi:high-affinity iron transporter
MLSLAIIIFREVLEISLILGVVLAATRGLRGRAPWVWAGLALGVAGAGLVALGAGAISEAVSGMGQELFDAAVLLSAAGLITWCVVWMKRHSAAISQRMRDVGQSVREGREPLYVLAVVTALAMLREGAEIVLMTYGVVLSGLPIASVFTGGAVGLALGTLVGLAVYFGLVRISLRYMFGVTGFLLMFLAAGMVSQAIGKLAAGGFIPFLSTPVWDTSRVLSEGTIAGSVLHTLVGYTAQPSALQVLGYLLTIALTTVLLRSYGGARGTGGAGVSRRHRIFAWGWIAVALAAVLSVEPAHATLRIYSPNVEYRELELEWRARYDTDARESMDGRQVHKLAVGYGVLPRLFLEAYAELERSVGDEFELEAIEMEARIQLTEPGQYWMDAGLHVEYEMAVEDGGTDELVFQVLLEKGQGRLLHRTNLRLERELESGAQTGSGLAWGSRLRLGRRFEPGVEYHARFGPLEGGTPFDSQAHLLGPVIYGKLGRVKYDLGYLFGLSDAAPEGMLKWIIEVEFHI